MHTHVNFKCTCMVAVWLIMCLRFTPPVGRLGRGERRQQQQQRAAVTTTGAHSEQSLSDTSALTEADQQQQQQRHVGTDW